MGNKITGPIYKSPVAGSIPYDPSTSQGGLTSTDVQGALDELSNGGGNTVSPGFTWGKSGNSNTNTWLLNDTVPSNITGRRIPVSGATIVEIYTSNQNLDTYTLGIYSHDGDSINLTLLATLSVVAARGAVTVVSVPVALNKQLAVRIVSGSGSNIVCGLTMRGTR